MKKSRKPSNSIAFKSISGIVLLLFVFSVIVDVIGYRAFTDALLEQYADEAFRTADIGATIVDADKLDEYETSGGVTQDYQQVMSQLDLLCDSTGSTFVYVIVPDRSDYATITFLFSASHSDIPYTVYEFGYERATTNDEYRKKYRAICERRSKRELVVRDKGYIETDPHITVMVPLKDSDGKVQAIMCVQRQMDELSKVRREYVSKVNTVLIILALLVFAGQSIYLHKTLIVPVKRITKEAGRFAAENQLSRTRLADSIRARDEIWELAGSIDHMEERICGYIDSLTHITAERQRIQTELDLARRIQADMLPDVDASFSQRKDLDISASMDPAKEVGGDFYDFFFIDEDRLGLVMADVSGKGIPAALFMMVSKFLVRHYAMSGLSPALVLEAANRQICANNSEEMFVTVWLGILDLKSGVLSAANAGHEYPVIRRKGGRFELFKDRHGFVLGGLEHVKYKEYTVQLSPGDSLFLYTDGVPESTNGSEKLFGIDRMIDALNRAPDTDAQQMLKDVRSAVDRFVGGAQQFDDLTMLCVRYLEPHEDDQPS